MNTVKTIIRGRRSCRAFTDEPISRDRINELINDAVWAPTGSNNQPWRFVVITDSSLMKKYSDTAKGDWLRRLGGTPHMQQYEEYIRDPGYNIFYNAAVLVIVYGNTESYWRVYDCTMVAYNLMLLAEEAGLGSCWIGFAHNIFAAKEIKEEFGIPENYELVAPVILGHTAKSEAASVVPRKAFAIKFHDIGKQTGQEG